MHKKAVRPIREERSEIQDKREMRPVERQLNRQEKDLCELEECCGHLEESLEPVLEEVPPPAKTILAGEEGMQQGTSQVGGTLHHNCCRLENLIARMNALRSRLAV